MRPLPSPARRATALVTGLVGLAVLPTAAPALAHPLGLPATARVVRTADTEVVVRWAAQPDDVAALAVAAGLRASEDGTVPADASLTEAEDAGLAASAELRALVQEQVAVTVDGVTACDQTFRPQPTVAVHGLEIAFTCPAPADEVAVTVGLLHDLDPRYRTLGAATTPDGEQQVMFTDAQPTHELALVEVGTGTDAAAGSVATADGTRPPAGQWGSSAAVSEGFSGFGVGWLDDRFLAAIDRPAGVAASVLGVLLALVVGAVHALAPGHGKAIAAAYLVGDDGRRRDAVVLGSTVALMHTGSVLLLGFALYSVTAVPDAARLGASIEAVAGGTFVGLGGWLLGRRWRGRRAGRGHGHHDADHADHAHDHAHHGDHAHEHPAEVAPDDSHLQRIVALGAAGGLLPSPSALLVLLTALVVGRLAYGLALVGAFSVGLAATLTLVGLAVLSGRDLVQRRLPARLHGWLHAAPLLGATVVVVLGAAILARAVSRLV